MLLEGMTKRSLDTVKVWIIFFERIKEALEHRRATMIEGKGSPIQGLGPNDVKRRGGVLRKILLFLINIQMELIRAVKRGQSRYNRRMERRMAVLFKGLL